MENENVVVKNQVILNLIQDLQRLLLHLISNVRGRCQIKFGMTTLILFFCVLCVNRRSAPRR